MNKITGLSKLISVPNRGLGRINHLKKYGETEISLKSRYVWMGVAQDKKDFCEDQIIRRMSQSFFEGAKILFESLWVANARNLA